MIDAHGHRVSGATPAALQAFEEALAAFQAWRGGVEAPLARALDAAPRFVMAHVLRAWLLLCGRDPQRVRAARPILARAAALPADARELSHLAAIAAVLDDDYERAKARLARLLRERPRDALALQVVHALDYMTGDAARMRARLERVLSAWSAALPGHHAVLAMHAFALEECGEYARAETQARAALALEPRDARAHHVMAHVFEMTGRADDGLRWMHAHAEAWAGESAVARHGWWHVALFELARQRPDAALALYDERVRAGHPGDVADLIDAAALLWRIGLHGADAGARWAELAAAWAPHIDDGFCSFSDLHAMLAFVGARDWANAARLERALARAQAQRTRHGATTRLLGLPACRALIAFGSGAHARARALLARLPAFAHRLGGSHAQRDVLRLTLHRASLHGLSLRSAPRASS
jgi:tetratricopeptide (TPR) repeat protein